MFYQKFLDLCMKKGVSKQKACVEAGLSSTAWIRWQTGSKPGAVSLQKICDYFNVTVDSMMDDDKEPTEIDDGIAAREAAFERPEMRILFDAAKGAPSSAILEAALKLMKLKEETGD